MAVMTQASEYRRQLASFHKRVIKNNEVLRIHGNSGDVVVLSADDYENMLETLYVLRDKATMASLFDIRKEVAKTGTYSGATIKEAFSDVDSSGK